MRKAERKGHVVRAATRLATDPTTATTIKGQYAWSEHWDTLIELNTSQACVQFKWQALRVHEERPAIMPSSKSKSSLDDAKPRKSSDWNVAITFVDQVCRYGHIIVPHSRPPGGESFVYPLDEFDEDDSRHVFLRVHYQGLEPNQYKNNKVVFFRDEDNALVALMALNKARPNTDDKSHVGCSGGGGCQLAATGQDIGLLNWLGDGVKQECYRIPYSKSKGDRWIILSAAATVKPLYGLIVNEDHCCVRVTRWKLPQHVNIQKLHIPKGLLLDEAHAHDMLEDFADGLHGILKQILNKLTTKSVVQIISEYTGYDMAIGDETRTWLGESTRTGRARREEKRCVCLSNSLLSNFRLAYARCQRHHRKYIKQYKNGYTEFTGGCYRAL